MRVALKIAYEGRSFFGHQRQPDVRTVEGECIAALRSAKIIVDATDARFRSASRTDRGVSALGNVIAFDASLPPAAVLGAFNGKARDVWAWAAAAVPDAFNPRHAEERWYRYHLFEPLPRDRLKEAAALFVGAHDFRWFSPDRPLAPLVMNAVDVTATARQTVIDVRARSFRRNLVRRIVAAMCAYAREEVRRTDLEAALRGDRHDFGSVPPEPLFLMEVRYDVAFRVLLKPKVLEEWAALRKDLELRERFLRGLEETVDRAARAGADGADAATM